MNKCINITLKLSDHRVISTVMDVSGKYPRGYGNRVSLQNTMSGQSYALVNLSREDLRDAVANGDIDDGYLYAVAYQVDNDFACYVIDTRLSIIARRAHKYELIPDEARAALARYIRGIPEDKCVCDTDDTTVDWMITKEPKIYSDDKGDKVVIGTCCGCAKQHQFVDHLHPVKVPVSFVSREAHRGSYGICVSNDLQSNSIAVWIGDGPDRYSVEYRDGIQGTRLDQVKQAQAILKDLVSGPLTELGDAILRYMALDPRPKLRMPMCGGFGISLGLDDEFKDEPVKAF